jgi:hypothetical protein
VKPDPPRNGKLSPVDLEAWLLEAGLAQRVNGGLTPTPASLEAGSALEL